MSCAKNRYKRNKSGLSAAFRLLTTSIDKIRLSVLFLDLQENLSVSLLARAGAALHHTSSGAARQLPLKVKA
jgi:hypothetical protein